jgi:hypothetical protein
VLKLLDQFVMLVWIFTLKILVTTYKMFLNEQKARARLESEKNLANRFSASGFSVVEKKLEPQIVEKEIKLPGNIESRGNLTKEDRTVIAIRSRTGENQKSLAREFGVTQANVGVIERGKTQGIDEEKVNKVINEVKDRALNRLMASLGLLDDDKLSGCSAKDLSIIASNMGRVVEKVSPKTDAPDNINFIIYSPELKKEKAYEVVEV